MGKKSRLKKEKRAMKDIFSGTLHEFKFEWKEWENRVGKQMVYKFYVGTCDGVFSIHDDKVAIIGIKNNTKGNGHLEAVFSWFEHAAKTLKKKLWVVEINNKRFFKHLVDKRGFQISDEKTVYKICS